MTRGGGMTAITEDQLDYQLLTAELDNEDLLFAGVLEDFVLGTGIDGPSSLHDVHITRDYENRTISLGQQTYIDDIIKHFELEDAHPISMPMEPGVNLTPGAPHISPIKLPARECSQY